MSISIAAMTGGINVSSARFRVRQYIRPLESSGVSIREFAAPFGAFPPEAKWLRAGWGACSLLSRVPALVKSRHFDIVLFQREVISTLVTLESLGKHPRVLDVDDAIWTLMAEKRARRLARMMDLVICGNEYIADYFSSVGVPVAVIPTAVDIHRFHPDGSRDRAGLVIGWSGSSGAFRELERIESSLANVLNRHPDVSFQILADRKPKLPKLPPAQVVFTEWSPQVEVGALQSMDIGIMPLADSPWNRGKCSYKMLLYMACGLPVVVSPVGMNVDLLARGQFGIAAESEQGWTDGLEELLANQQLRMRFGRCARRLVEEQFSIEAVVPRLAEVFKPLKD